ncbi:MAG: anthranilate synthase component I family protein [Candidatus Caldatribacterium sp.]|nr:anthranilate synthase component I family protein [Candidatus Caldatribacterium sp.]
MTRAFLFGVRKLEIRPSKEEFYKLSAQYDYIPLHAECLADRLTPVVLFEHLRRGSPVFLLESAERGETWGRYSFLIRDVEEEEYFFDFMDLVTVLERKYPSFSVYPSLALPFLGGAVGFLSYDAVKTWEKTVPKKPVDFPLAYFATVRRYLFFDHLKHLLGAVYIARAGDEGDFLRGVAWIQEVMGEIKRYPLAAEKREGFRLCGPIRSNFTKEAFERAVRRVIELIEEGHASQVVISQRFTVPHEGDPFQAYRILRSLNPSPYLFYFETPGFTLLGSSPEMMVKVEGRKVTTRPIAGTRRRLQGVPEEEIIQDLLGDEKENAEHVMLLDLGRNDLGRVCELGSVQVEEYMKIERYSHVFHIVSTVSGVLRQGMNPWRALQACFPAGTVSGAPKVRAMEIIEEIEPESRGPYAGALGYVSFQGNMDTCIVIRSIFFKDGIARVQAGAGVVYDSVPEREYEETRSKAEALLLALQLAEKEESV